VKEKLYKRGHMTCLPSYSFLWTDPNW